MQQTFLDIIYKIFYDTAQRDFKDIRLILSEKFFYPDIQFEPKVEVKIPIPKKTAFGISYAGFHFKDTPEEMITAWGIFLATVYHLAAHVAVTDYSVYKDWTKNKTPKVFWRVIDFIEDNSVARYLSTTNPDVWNNISQINQKFIKVYGNDNKESKFSLKIGTNMLESIKKEMNHETLQVFDDLHKKRILNWATSLYKHSKILPRDLPSYYEQHESGPTLLLQKNKINFFPSGQFQNTIKKLNFLYLEEKERLDNILYKLRKDLSGLNFDEIVIPNEDIYEYFQLKEKNKKIIKKIREQIRSVYNNSEDPQTNF
ncbi:MAG: hypothetical protein ACE5RI_03255, partial [Candidatus Nitrosomaritimum yanchengensis]